MMMELRDYLAAKAMQSFLRREDALDLMKQKQSAAHIARDAYAVADDMLAERAKGKEPK